MGASTGVLSCLPLRQIPSFMCGVVQGEFAACSCHLRCTGPRDGGTSPDGGTAFSGREKSDEVKLLLDV